MNRIFNIYCDESCHLEHDGQKAMTIGGIWCPENKKKEIFRRIREIKVEHGLNPFFEIKWNKISPKKLSFYMDIVNYFFDNSDLHFRVLVIPDKRELNHHAFNQTHDDFYYKVYFDMLKAVFRPDCGYNVYIDIKDTRGQKKVDKLHEVLCHSQYDFDCEIIRRVQQVNSREIELVALADLLVGAVSYLHRGLNSSEAKMKIIDRIKSRSGYDLSKNTLYLEQKFNVFIWKSGYGR
ncbi:MAG: DUF3800 domain-containing protein [Coprobacter sp.]|nr:DUF3800 domain-containing protein [Coprobacter sp.]